MSNCLKTNPFFEYSILEYLDIYTCNIYKEESKSGYTFSKCLDQLVGQDNEVRIIDIFVERIKLEDFKFIVNHNTEGWPAYDPKNY